MIEGKWYELNIELKDIKPRIWRSFLVDSDITLPNLHKVIQTIMGWSNSHLHQFVKDDIIFSLPDEEGFMDSINYTNIRLCEVLKTVGDSIIYEYDFGDDWEHDSVSFTGRIQEYINKKVVLGSFTTWATPYNHFGDPTITKRAARARLLSRDMASSRISNTLTMRGDFNDAIALGSDSRSQTTTTTDYVIQEYTPTANARWLSHVFSKTGTGTSLNEIAGIDCTIETGGGY